MRTLTANETGTKKTLRKFIEDNFMLGLNAEGLADHDSLVGRGIVDSTGVLEIVAFLEETFKITVEDEDLVPEHFDTIGNLVAYVERKIRPC